ncbi:PREDICTED: pectinesterase 2-like [Tarenaya hassleriana]|uniref:pectinesterase 2-like n=1 Tax=Tarenaya hassleriana TaxID=28532 RepID=UPI00053C44E8|nr:PREDICTED: pectinesterase 2-like [Tarenaya hassleriana]
MTGKMTPIKNFIARFSDFKNNKKLILLSAATALLLLVAVAGISAGASAKANSKPTRTLSPASHSVLRSACSSTIYRDLCVSAVSTAAAVTGQELTSQRDVIEASLNITKIAVEHNYFTVKKLLKNRKGLTEREKTALHDCLETIDETLDEIHEAVEDLNGYPNEKKSLRQHADDLKTLISSAITNQETCLDGFSHDKADKKVRKALEKGQVHVEHMCSNALAMIKNMTDTDIASFELKSNNHHRKLMEETVAAAAVVSGDGWPEWISAGDRRLLQATTVKADATVNVVDGSTTFHSATVAVVGERFLARDITFENTAGPSKHQAVALRVGSDFSAFYQCDVLAYQDSLYVHSNRQFFVKCIIAGTVDFIFGNAAVVLQDCDIHARRPNSGQKNMVTAQGRTDPNQNTGIVIQKCRIGATSDLQAVKGSFPTYLGRPWKEYSRTVVMQSEISDVIRPEGWHEWNGNFALDTLTYGEYANTGAGAGTANRVTWKGFKVITSATEAQEFTAGQFIGGGSWLSSTGFPFSLGL